MLEYLSSIIKSVSFVHRLSRYTQWKLMFVGYNCKMVVKYGLNNIDISSSKTDGGSSLVF